MTEKWAKYNVSNGMSELEASFLFHWRMLAPWSPVPVSEHKFCDERDWRFDFSWLQQKVAVECEGGIWTRGRHTRGVGFEKDCEKYNRATADGWRVFRCTAGMLKRDPVAFVEIVLQTIKEINETKNRHDSNGQAG